MSRQAGAIAHRTWTALGGDPADLEAVRFVGEGGLPSVYPVTDFAAGAIASAGLAIRELLRLRHPHAASTVMVDRRLASFWFGFSLRPLGWQPPPIWDPIAGDYRAADGWIRLHTNAPRHRAACERILGVQTDRAGVAAAVARWAKGELESAIVSAGGCAAEMRSTSEWKRHPQGRAVDREPLAHLAHTAGAPAPNWSLATARPLEGIRVLDLTRVLAGPVATRFLAGYGAQVLRIDPRDWDEGAVIPEVTLGKRCARLDLRAAADREGFRRLLGEADVLIHGYRPGALDALGFDSAARRDLAPGLVDISLDAYGWSGPWAARRGFDSLVQMSTGIAEAGMRWRKADHPVPLPVQALDHATGYLMAAAAIRGLTRRLTDGAATVARLSLARTASVLIAARANPGENPLAPEALDDLASETEETDWGAARRLRPPLVIAETPLRWDRPARMLGTSPPDWS